MAFGIRFCIFLALTAVLGGILGCNDKPPARDGPAATVAPGEDDLPLLEKPKPGKDGKVDPVEQARYDYVRLSSAAAKAGERYKVLRRIAGEELLDAQVMWITGVALLIAALAGVAAFLAPVGKKTLVALAIGCTVIAACAQAFRVAAPYLPWIGGALIIGAGIWVAVNWRKLGQTVQTAADHGDRLEKWLTEDLLPQLGDKAREKAEAIIADVKRESQTQAQRLGTHSTLQYLRGKSKTVLQRLFTR